MTNPVLVGVGGDEEKKSSRSESGRGAVAASRVLWALGIIYVVGTLVDLFVLWFVQRQPGLQWEFVAVTNTVEAWPRLILGVAMMYLGAHLAGSESMLTLRLLGGAVLVLGVLALVLAGLVAMNYLQVRGGMPDQSAAVVQSAVLKNAILCGLYVLLLIPSGLLGLLRLGKSS